MKPYTGTSHVRNRYNVDHRRLWEMIQHGPVALSVGDDFTDSHEMARFQAAVYCGTINRQAREIGHRVRTRTVDGDLIVWIEPQA